MSRRSEAVVDERLPTPLYHQIFLILHGQIVEGRLVAGAQVPGEEELARQFNVSRITARRALAELAAEGMVTRSRGRGTHVTARDHEPPPVHGGVEGLIENLMAMGLKTQVTLLDFGYEPAAPDVAAALQVAPGAEVQRAVRIRSLADGPFSHLTTYVPADIGRKFGRKEMAREPLLGLLERSGVVIGSAEQTLSATLADTRVAPLLKTSIGAPLLRISRIVQDSHGRPVEYIIGLYRPDRYQFRMSLDRVRGEDRNTWSASVAPATGEPSAAPRSRNREKK
ncbi:MAG: GntR family transcriptional regulator [Ferrovibrio sp.]|uniref:GntR family transcriptional regulator n=1 Tax=Ferrovibrio sp. TaxID=1917215 RepID=UPI00262272E7|nr:GntR family transcriptional regulator [Ferrovibrio sp.]MCW0235054.1 GntR family transcriptional regulator [Ferrovibrio sp.]